MLKLNSQSVVVWAMQTQALVQQVNRKIFTSINTIFMPCAKERYRRFDEPSHGENTYEMYNLSISYAEVTHDLNFPSVTNKMQNE